MLYDAAIIGTGPAGLSAALNLKIHNKNFIWLGSKALSDKITKAERISNYPGFTNVSGAQLTEAFQKQIADMQIEITEQMVSSILPFGDHYALMAGSEYYETKTIILTTGMVYKASLAGEGDYIGRGVSYCATCDGSLYRGKTIAVLCNNRRFEHEVRYLAELAGKVYYFAQYPGPSEMPGNVEAAAQRAVSVLGEERVSAIGLADGTSIPVEGIFCLRDSITLSTLLPELATEDGHIAVDRGMRTNLPGVYAAGDCTGQPYQYTKAVGEGNVAAHSLIADLG